MNSRTGHLEEGELLRLIDGELADDAAGAARSHIESCWQCRTHFQEFETVIGEYVRYQKNTDLLLPPPPRAWPELRFSSAPEIEPPAIRLLPTRRWFDWRSGMAAAGVVLAVLVWHRLQTPPKVNAATLLRKAMATESIEGSIRIRLKSGTLLRPAILRNGATHDDTHLREMFERAHFDWDRPLSARAFARWREQLKDKQDEVQLEKDDVSENAYLIHTSTPTNELRRATLTLRARDMQPVREMLEFTGETVEIERAPESAQQPAPMGSPAVDQVPASSDSPANNGTPLAEVTLHHLLQVFATLHRLGDDLGEPIEIRQSAGRIEVGAVGLSASRQQQLRAALEAVPTVSLSFESGGSDARARREATSPVAGPSPGQAALENVLGSAEAAEDFTDRALDSSDAVLARVHALRALAKAFPPLQETALNDADRQLLGALRRDHGTALIKRIADLRSVLRPVVSVNSSEAVTPNRVSNWQAEAENLFLSAQQFDETLNHELAGNVGNRSDFSRIAEAFAQLDRKATEAVSR
jgi:hypothetical protein